MDYKNKIGIILTGYSIDKKQMEDHVTHFQNNGFNNIVISSYRNYISEKLNKTIPIVYNEEVEGYTYQAKIRNKNYINELKYKNFNKSITDSEKINLIFDIKDKSILEEYKSAFIIASSTIRGINKIKNIYPNVEYVLRIRADAKITNLNLINEELLEKMKQSNNDKFKNLILVPGFPKEFINQDKSIKWYVCDFWIFGNINDIYKYYNNCNINNKKKNFIDGKNEKYIITKINDKFENFNKYFLINNDIEIYWEKQMINKKFYNFEEIKFIFENEINTINMYIAYLYQNDFKNINNKYCEIFIDSLVENKNNIIIVPNINTKKINKITKNIYNVNIFLFVLFQHFNIKTIFQINKLKSKFKQKILDQIKDLVFINKNSFEFKFIKKFKQQIDNI